MKKLILLLIISIVLTTYTFSQVIDSIQTKITDISLTGKLTIATGDTQKIRLENTGKAFFDGKITAREIEVKSNVWSDYVFNKDYKLLPINDLEKFVKENNKLPEVPSEKEAAKGINLGNMDAMLLKKIEELTLYIIKQQKEIDALKEKLNVLQEIKK